MSYISPIKLNTIPDMEEGWTDKIAKYIAGETDKLVLESCVKVACDVDEEELLKALQYDRGQYEKGYADGKRDAASPWHRVKDGLPPKATWVLTVATEGNVKLFNIATVDAGGQWWTCSPQNILRELYGVRYWMPIEPPKEDA